MNKHKLTGSITRRLGGSRPMSVVGGTTRGTALVVWYDEDDQEQHGEFPWSELYCAPLETRLVEHTKGAVSQFANELRREFKQRLTSAAMEYVWGLLEGRDLLADLDMALRCRVALSTAARISNEVHDCPYETGEDVNTLAVQLEDARCAVLPHAYPDEEPVWKARDAMQDMAQRQVDEVLGAFLVKCEGAKPTGEDLRHWRTLTDKERKTLTDWADGGAGFRAPMPQVRSRAECLAPAPHLPKEVPNTVTITPAQVATARQDVARADVTLKEADVHTSVDPKHVEPMPTLDELGVNARKMGEAARRHTDAIAAELAKAPQTGLRSQRFSGLQAKVLVGGVLVGKASLSYSIKADFKDQDPDRVAVSFKEQMVRAVEKRLQETGYRDTDGLALPYGTNLGERFLNQETFTRLVCGLCNIPTTHVPESLAGPLMAQVGTSGMGAGLTSALAHKVAKSWLDERKTSK